MSVAKFKVQGIPLDDASTPQQGTVLIDRAAGLITVRPYRRRREFTLPLAEVAQRIVRSILFAERMERGRAKAAAKKLTRDARNERQRSRARSRRARA